jgi:cytochrome P450
MTLIPREVSLNHLVSRVLPAFDTYGDIFQLVLPLPLNVFCLRKPDHIKAVSSRKECGTDKPGHMIPKADFFMGDGVYNDLGGPTWMAKRRSLAPAFTEANSQLQSERLPDSFERMKSRWLATGSGLNIEIYAELQRMVLDFGARALFSKTFDDNELDWVVDSMTFSEMMFTTLTPHWVPTPSNLRFRQIKSRYHSIIDTVIGDRRRTGESSPDMIHALMNAENPITGKPHTDEEIKAQILSAYFGTPAMTLTVLWSLFFLSTRPEILAKLREELNRVIGNRSPRAEDLANLPYLEMLVKEVLRAYPSFWGSLRYAKDPVEIDGYEFPPKSIFAMIRFAAQRHPDHWDQPDAFMPERHEVRNSCPHAYLPFGLGPRMCLGRSLATIVAPLAVASIAQNFDVRFQSDAIEVKYGFGIYPAKPMWAAVQQAKGPGVAGSPAGRALENQPSQQYA